MLTLREYVAQEIKNCATTYEYFQKCWNVVNPNHPCKSNQIALDAGNYNRAKSGGRFIPIPLYVESCYNRWKASHSFLPPQAQKTLRWMDAWNHQHYRLVSSADNLLIARKCRDGVWRT